MKLKDAIDAAQKLQREKLLNGGWCNLNCDGPGIYVERIIAYGRNMNPVEFEVTDD